MRIELIYQLHMCVLGLNLFLHASIIIVHVPHRGPSQAPLSPAQNLLQQ